MEERAAQARPELAPLLNPAGVGADGKGYTSGASINGGDDDAGSGGGGASGASGKLA
jgi:hypothetical protein